MKKSIAMLLALAMVIGWIAIPPAHAHAEETTQSEEVVTETVTDPTDPEVDGATHLTFDLNEDGESYRVSGHTDTLTGALTIPSTYCGLPVTAIGNSAFSCCNSLTSVVIPDSVTAIGSYVFDTCESLTNVVIGNGVTTIGDAAFKICTNLTSITIGDGVTDIGQEAFFCCTALTDVYYTGTKAQWSAITISSIFNDPLLNANITFLGEDSTEPSTEPTTAPTVATEPSTEATVAPTEATVTPIEPSVEATEVTEPSTVATAAPTEPSADVTEPSDETTEATEPEVNWEEYLYFDISDDGQSYRVSGFTENFEGGALTIPSTYGDLPVTAIGNNAFSFCNSLTSVVIPDSVTEIWPNAFANCSNLQSVELPDGLIAITEYAFTGCSSLSEIQIPASVCYIGAGAFNACPLDGIWVDENNPYYTNDAYGVLFSKDMTNLMAAPYTLARSYAIPDGVEFICTGAFLNTRLSTVTFPDSVMEIGYYAFQNSCLTEIVIGNGVANIATDAFSNSGYLTSVTIPDTVVNFGTDVFGNCPELTVYCHIGTAAAAYAVENDIPVSYLDTVTELSIATMPDKLIYPLDGHLKLDGLSLNVTLEGDEQTVLTDGYTVSEYDFSTAGTKTITVSVGELSVSFDVVVDATLIEYPESDHPYQNSSDITWKFTYPAEVDGLEITFSEDTMTENGCDHIYICDSEGNEARYTGTELVGKTITVPGKFFTIRLVTDGSMTNYGFAITSIEAVMLVDWETVLTFTLNENGTGYIVSDCDEAAEGVLEIPAEYSALPVVAIGDNALRDCTGLTNVIILEGVTEIGAGAFEDCSSLKKITLPVSVAAIGDSAFLGCDKLANVYYGGSQTRWSAVQMGENNDALSNAKLNIPQDVCEHVPGRTVVQDEWGGNGCYESKYQTVVIYCADCSSEIERKTVVIPATGHTPGEPIIENMSVAGCTNSGSYLEITYCTVCNSQISSVTVAVDPTGHTEGETEVYEQPATCTYVGYRETLTYCADCGSVINRVTEEFPATGHTPGRTEVDRTDPWCCGTGYIQTAQYCADCGFMIDIAIEILPVTDHIPGEVWVEVESYGSCTSDYIYYNRVSCQDCGRLLSSEKVVEPATGHIPGEAQILSERAADCVNAGYREIVVYCAGEYCGRQLSYTSEFIPALGHTEEIIPGYAPTCTEYGVTDGVICSACGEIIVMQWDEPPLGHTPGNAVVENETATSYESVIYCETCGVELSREFVNTACAHENTSATTEETPATCTTPGSVIITITCDDCGEVVGGDGDEIPALGHTPGNAVVENETATSYESVVYCETCGIELSREVVETACAHENTTTTTTTVDATCTTAGSVTTIVTCECGEVISETTEETPATGIHAYTDDNDAVCNDCGFVRQMVDTFEFVNYRVVFTDSDSTHKNPRVIIYKLGDQTVEDPSNEKALKAIDSAAETIWQAASINNILLTDAGNYVLMLKYNVGTATVSVPMAINITADPKLIIDKNNKLTVIDDNGANINHRVVVYYLGDETVDDIYDETALKAIDSAPETVWQKKAINRLALTKGGNYVLHLCYNVGTGAKQTVAQTFTVFSIPTLAVDQNNMLVATEENAENKNHRVTVFYLGSATVSDPFNETQVKNAAISSQTYWGLSAINKVEILQGGNYVFHMYYNVGTGAKRTLALEATLTERPALSVSEDNKLVVTYSDASITNPRAYIYNVGDKTVSDIYDETALKKIATPTQVWGLSSILRKQLTPGTYVIHLHYNVASGAKSTVALKITIEA